MTIKEAAEKYGLTFEQVNFGCIRGRFESVRVICNDKGKGGRRWQRDVLDNKANALKAAELKKKGRRCPTLEKAKKDAERSGRYRIDGAMAQEVRKANYVSIHGKRVRGYQTVNYFSIGG